MLISFRGGDMELGFKKAKEKSTGKEVLRQRPLEETFAKTDAIGDAEEVETSEPTIYEENAIEVLLNGEVPDTYSIALYDM